MTHITTFPKRWRFTYWFPSNNFIGDEPSEYIMTAVRHDDTLVLESEPNDIGAYMLARLKIDGQVATGNWYETTSQTGEFKGAQYSGSGQLLISPDTGAMEGKWAGAGYDHKLQQMRIYSGNWEIAPLRED
jgi:hypothetical protein